jgi:dienelactone hydrolase
VIVKNAFAAWIAAVSSIALASTAIVVEETSLDVTIGGHPYKLSAIVAKPADASGRLPVALVAHGSPRDHDERATYRAIAMLSVTRELAHRGWLAVHFLRRGFGASQGPFAEGFACQHPDYRRALATTAEDIEAVRVAIVRRPDADGARVLGIGVSVGGAGMLAWSATRPEGLVGVVDLSGGTGSLTAETNCDADALVGALADYGSRSRVPTLWLYAENDHFFGPALVRRMYAAYTTAGGRAKLELFRPVGEDGHQLWRLFDGQTQWLPALDRFLRAENLPTWDPRPAETARRRLDVNGRNVLTDYLAAPTEKSIALARGKGVIRWWSNVGALAVARQKAIELCERDAHERCEVLMDDFALAGPR